MRCGLLALGALDPVLIEEGGEPGLPKLDLPQDAEQRGHGLLALALEAEERGGAIGGPACAGLRSRAETEIDALAPRRRGELEMRDLVQEDIGLGLTAQRRSIPAE